MILARGPQTVSMDFHGSAGFQAIGSLAGYPGLGTQAEADDGEQS